MRRFKNFISEETDQDDIENAFEYLLKSPKNEKSIPRILHARNIINDGFKNKQIRNADFKEAKSIITYAYERARDEIKDKHYYPKIHADDSYRMNQHIYDVFGYPSLHTLNSEWKKLQAAKKAVPKFGWDEIEEFVKKTLPLKGAFDDLKKTIVMGRAPPVMTPEKEKERKEKEENARECQICGRMIQSKKGLIAHHGFKRPGTGWQTSSCFGARYRPYNVASDALPLYIKGLKHRIESLQKTIHEYKTDPPQTFQVEKRGYGNRANQKVYYTRIDPFNPSGYDPYAKEWRIRVLQLESSLKSTFQELQRVEERLKNWKAPK